MGKFVVLASASPRRRDLLESAGYDVLCDVSGADELEATDGDASELALENARRKVSVVAARHPGAIVIAADTVVAMDGEFFGKPANDEHAVEMLSRMSGRTHEVVTGVVLVVAGVWSEFAESTRVTFHDLEESGWRNYVRAVPVLDKAGAYAAQGDGGRIIARMEGSVSNVIGLPMERLERELARLFECSSETGGRNHRDQILKTRL